MKDINAILPDIRLRFNIEHPIFEECYAFGYECGTSGVNETENPYMTGSKESEQWLEGWWAGFYGEEPLFTLSANLREEAEVTSRAVNDEAYQEEKPGFVTKMLEITGVIAVSTLLGYQVVDLVA